MGRDHELAVAGRRHGASQFVVQGRHISTQFPIAAENAQVLINSGSAFVVVSGSNVDIAANAVLLLANDEGQLDMSLQPLHTIGDVHPLSLKQSAPGDVGRFIEARGDLNQHHHLFALACRFQQRLDDRRLAAGAIDGQLNCQHLRVNRRTLQEM